MIKHKHILVGITGGIAAYKTAFLVRNLVKLGAEVKVVMTDAAASFIGPLTLATLSKNEVYRDLYDEETGTWANHVELAQWADLIMVAPATSNTIAKMANGQCDNLLMAVLLSAKSPVAVAPAMDLDMAEHPSLLRNLDALSKDGALIVPYEEGELASGLVGKGRMAEPDTITDFIVDYFTPSTKLNGKRILINAGPTHEPIDPVRFIGNRSTGKMGVALANAAANLGAQVTLVLGPTEHSFDFHPAIDVIRIQTAADMFNACTDKFTTSDIAILSAAVADYRPAVKADQKIKKSTKDIALDLVKTEDTLAKLGKVKREDQLLIGFALETTNELENAKSKLTRKNLDLIVLNSLQDKGAGFGHDSNKISIIDKNERTTWFDLKDKQEVAKDILNAIETLLHD